MDAEECMPPRMIDVTLVAVVGIFKVIVRMFEM